MSRLRQFAAEVAALRREIVKGIPEDDPITVTLSAEHMAVVIYSLGSAWLSEAISRIDGYEAITTALGRVSAEIMHADLGPQIDKFIDETLGGEGEGEAA